MDSRKVDFVGHGPWHREPISQVPSTLSAHILMLKQRCRRVWRPPLVGYFSGRSLRGVYIPFWDFWLFRPERAMCVSSGIVQIQGGRQATHGTARTIRGEL